MANVVKEKHSISSELAQKNGGSSGREKPENLALPRNVAILDDGGNLKAFSRMDGAPILFHRGLRRTRPYTSAVRRLHGRDFFNLSRATRRCWLAFPTLCACRGIRRRVSHQSGRRKLSEGDWGERGHHSAETTSIAREERQPWRFVPGAVPAGTMMGAKHDDSIAAQRSFHTHQTAPTRFSVEANGIRFAYRRFGKPDGVPPRFQPALYRHDGTTGTAGDRRLCQGTEK